MREMNAQEIVRWLNELERRCRRLKWIASLAVLVAIVALVLPALPNRISPWSRDEITAHSLRSPDRIHTGDFAIVAADGRDPSVVLTNSNQTSHAALEIERGVPKLGLTDEGGSRVRMQLAPDPAWEGKDEGRKPLPGEKFYGLTMREPDREGHSRIGLGGDEDLLSLELQSPTYGSARLWAGRQDVPVTMERNPDLEGARREPGSALALVDREGVTRAAVTLLKQPPPANDRERDTFISAQGPIPAVTLYDQEGNERAVIRLDPVKRGIREDGTIRMSDPVFAPSMTLRDHLGRARIVLKLDAEGNPTIRLLDDHGLVLWSVP